MKKWTRTALATVLAFGAAACDTDPVGPNSGTATMQVVVYGDADMRSSSMNQSQSGEAASEARGNIDVRARVYVQSQTNGWVELTQGAAARQTVNAATSTQGQLLTTSSVAADSYTRVRVVFEDVRAQVTGGLTIGTGLLQGEVRVGGQGQTTVEREVRFTAQSGSTSQLMIDLNAQTWLQRADASTRVVSEAEFRNAVAITVR
jgi:hypothetical protein